MERFGKTKLRRGFTLAEVLIVVAVLAALSALAIPAAIASYRALRLNELDDSARSIFIAAQNRMTAMVGNGELDTFAKVPDPTTGTLIEVARPLTEYPKDFPEDASGDPDESHGRLDELRYLDSNDPAHQDVLKQLLPGASIESELTEHRYIVEYNSVTGAVYAVWYSDENDFQDLAAVRYESFAIEERDRATRLKAEDGYAGCLVGYYGGSGIEYATVGQMPVPELTLTNAEELRLRIKVPETPAGVAGAGHNFAPQAIGLVVTVTGKDSGVTKTILGDDTVTDPRLQTVKLDDDGQIACLMLDTLEPDTSVPGGLETGNNWEYGQAFHDWAKDSDLIPGEDITVTVKTYYAGGDGKSYLPREASVTCNSLFAAVDVDAGIATASIAYGRHLQNLDAYTATGDADGSIGVGMVGGVPKGTAITAAKQTRPIDFKAVNGTFSASGGFTPPGVAEKENDIYYWADTYGTVNDTTGIASGLKSFTAIYNSALTTYNGQSLPIRNLNAVHNGNAASGYTESAGLFAWFGGSGAILENITLVDPAAEAATNVGALAGMAADTTIVNCQVYLDGLYDAAALAAAKDPIYDPADGTVPRLETTAGGSTGGLVGQVEGDTFITNSFAAAVADGTGAAGGLVGQALTGSALTIEKSYAACYLNNGAQVGGLVGNATGTVNITYSYAAGIIANASGTAAGLVAQAPAAAGSTLTINNSYAAVRYGKDLPATTTVYGAAPGMAATPNNVYYVKQSGVAYADDSGTDVTTKDLSEMPATDAAGATGNTLNNKDAAGDPIWYNLPAEKEGTTPGANPTYATFPYKQTDETEDLTTPYPYPQLRAYSADPTVILDYPMLHYGDWLESEDAGGLLAYVEQYGADDYGVWARDEEGTLVISTLNDTVAVEDDFYCVLVEVDGSAPAPAPASAPDITVDGSTTYTLETSPLAWTVKSKSGDKEYYLYKFDKLYESLTQGEDYYHKLTVGSSEYWFNPFYACEVQKPDAAVSGIADATPMAKPGAEGVDGVPDADSFANKVVIRTARQLANLAAATGSTAGSGTDAEKAAQGRSYVQLLDIDYSVYEGDDLKVGKEGLTEQPPAALNGSGSYDGNEHTIKNLHIEGRDSADNLSVAGLFGTTQGVLKNIRLVNVDVDGGDDVGALAGYYQGTAGVTNCGAYVDYSENIGEDYSETFTVTGGDDVGGLIGTYASSAALTECFAAVKVDGNDNVGGLVGQIDASGGPVTLTDCYAGGHTEGGVYVVKVEGGAVTKSANVYGNGNVGGLVGTLSSGGDPDNTLTLSGVNYSTCSVQVLGTDTDTLGLLIGDAEDDTVIPDGTAYATGTAFDSDGKALEAGGFRDEGDYGLLTVGDIDDSGTTPAHPYDSTLYHTNGTAMPYPYTSNLDEHYGDWMAATKVEAEGIAYFEEEDGEIKLQLYGSIDWGDGRTEIIDFEDPDTYNINPLCTRKDMKAISNSGYLTFKTGSLAEGSDVSAVALSPELGDPSIEKGEEGEGGAGASPKNAIQKFLRAYADKNGIDAPLDTFTFNIYNTREAGAVTGSDALYTASGAFGTGTEAIYYTNGFAKLSKTPFGGEYNPFQIRTDQQLDNIPDDVGSTVFFRQAHDIHGGGGHSGAASFAGDFDGRGYRIQALTSGNTQDSCTGLFKSLIEGAKVRNVVLYSSEPVGISGMGEELPVTDPNAELLQFGGIANTAEGTVSLENCVVAGYSTTFDLTKPDVTEFYYGGLIGQVTGDVTVTNCAAINDATADFGSERKKDDGQTVAYFYGGLVGRVSGSGKLTLENCYTGGQGQYTGGDDAVGMLDVSVDAGAYGLTGQTDGGSVTANNCYSWLIDGSKNISTVAPLSKQDLTATNNYYLSNSTVENRNGLQGKYVEFLAGNGDPLLSSAGSAFGEAASSHPTDSAKKYDDFPFPEVIKAVVDEDGNPTAGNVFVHYGDWPTDATSGPEFGFFFVYGTSADFYYGDNVNSYAVAVMFDKESETTYKSSQMGTIEKPATDYGTIALRKFWGFAIRKANRSKMQAIKDNLTVEFYRAYTEGGTNSPTYKFDFTASTPAIPKPESNKFNNENTFDGYDLFIADGNFLNGDDIEALAGENSRIIVKYGDNVIASFNWADTVNDDVIDPSAPGGDPGASADPEIFEPQCSCTVRCTEDTVNPYCPVCGAGGTGYTACQAPAPAENATAPGGPTEDGPTEGSPAEDAPTQSSPAESGPTAGGPVEGDPAQSTPAQSAPTEDSPTEGDATEGGSTEGSPTNTPTGTPAEGAPTEGSPAAGDPPASAPTNSPASAPAADDPAAGTPAPDTSPAPGGGAPPAADTGTG